MSIVICLSATSLCGIIMINSSSHPGLLRSLILGPLGQLWLGCLPTLFHAYLTLIINECRVMGWFSSLPIPFLRLGKKKIMAVRAQKPSTECPWGAPIDSPPPQQNTDTDLRPFPGHLVRRGQHYSRSN